MNKFDYIVVGQGLAGTVLIYKLLQLGKSVCLIDKERMSAASMVALGAYNPLVLKRFTPCWKIEYQLPELYDFIRSFEDSFHCTIHQPFKLLRKFVSIEEQNLWLEKSEGMRLKPYMKSTFIRNNYKHLKAGFGFGEVTNSGRVFLPLMISTLRSHMKEHSLVIDDIFSFADLDVNQNKVRYKDVEADHIVFCEGYRMSKNPYFNYLPLNSTKGELLTVKLKNAQVEELIKSGVYLMPLGNDLYRVAATFNNGVNDEVCTVEGKNELLVKLSKLVDESPQVVNHQAGIRPTVKDRRALIGVHPEHSNMFIFNGLGTRGILLAPYLAKQLISFIEDLSPLDPEVNIKRFEAMHT